MLQRDYIVEMTQRFGNALTRWLKPAVLEGDLESIGGVETAVAELLDLPASTALSLDPASLVTIMELSGIADSVAGYVSYALLRLGDAYDAAGEASVAEVRRQQARAIAGAFGAELGKVPEEYEELEREIATERGEE